MTNYQKLIMEYAKVLQLYSPSGTYIYKDLELKRTLYSESTATQEKFDFWSGVLDAFVGNSQKILFDLVKVEEVEAKRDPDKIREIVYLKRKKHTNATLWFTTIPDTRQYIYQILKSRRDYDAIKKELRYEQNIELRNKQQKELTPNIFATKSALYPCMSGYRFSNRKTDYFKFIPLVTWSLENLFYYSRYAPECDKFIETIVIPLYRLHLQYANEFLSLMNREDELYGASTQFGDENKFNHNAALKDEADWCHLSTQLQTIINMKNYNMFDTNSVKTLKRSNLLYSIYRIEKLVDLYEVPDYFHTINNSDMERALNSVNHISNIFSVDNIKAQLTNRIYSLSTSPDFYDREIFEETFTEVMTSLENLAHINILTASDVVQVKKEIDRPISMRREIIGRDGKN